MRGYLAAGVAVLFLLPTAAATFAFEGSLRPDGALGFDGVLAVRPGNQTVGLLQLEPFDAAAVPLMLRAPAAEVVVLRWEASPLAAATASGPLPSSAPEQLHDVSLNLESAGPNAEMLVYVGTQGTTGFAAEARAAECAIERPRAGDPTTFPTDPQRVSRPQVLRAHDHQLRATCTFDTASLSSPENAGIYGADVWLASAERNELVRTGTFEEPLFPGSPMNRTITQILRVSTVGYPLAFELSRPGTVRWTSAGLLGVGTLHTGPMEADLQWGGWHQDGPSDGVRATGVFDFSGDERDRIAVHGATLDGPSLGGGSPANHRTIGAGLWWGLGMAGLALLAPLAWLLYPRLAGGRVLLHPTRTRIFEAVRHDAGITIGELAGRLGLPWTLAAHHAMILCRSSHLVLRRVGGRTALFPANAGYHGHELPTALRRRSSHRRVLQLLAESPGLDQATLGARLRLGQSRVSKVLTALAAAGLVEPRAGARRTVYWPADGVNRMDAAADGRGIATE